MKHKPCRAYVSPDLADAIRRSVERLPADGPMTLEEADIREGRACAVSFEAAQWFKLRRFFPVSVHVKPERVRVLWPDRKGRLRPRYAYRGICTGRPQATRRASLNT